MQFKTEKYESDVELLHELFSLDETSPSGLRWRHDAQTRGRKAGDRAGRLGSQGYWEVGVARGGVVLRVHRIVWILAHGAIPKGLQIDHKNGRRSDNSITNLQLVTTGTNSRARNRVPKSNLNGCIGVSRHQKSGKWMARAYRGRHIYLGCFASKIQAAKAYNDFIVNWSNQNGESARYLNPV
jgi:hypothetical protein